MYKKWMWVIIIVVIVVMNQPQTKEMKKVAGETKQIEYAIGGGSNYCPIAANNWCGQSFTTMGAFTLTKIVLKLTPYGYSAGAAGTITVNLMTLNAGMPDQVLSTTTIDGNIGGNINIDLPDYPLSVTTQYVITLSTLTGDRSSKYVKWFGNGLNEYSGGGSYLNGVSSPLDSYFEIWGVGISVTYPQFVGFKDSYLNNGDFQTYITDANTWVI